MAAGNAESNANEVTGYSAWIRSLRCRFVPGCHFLTYDIIAKNTGLVFAGMVAYNTVSISPFFPKKIKAMTHFYHNTISRRAGLGKFEVIAILVVIFVLLSLVFAAINIARACANRVQCTNNLKQFGLGMHTYHDAHKFFPMALTRDSQGHLMHSWRLRIIPYIMGAGYEPDVFNTPWDSASNIQYLNAGIGYIGFSCPNALRAKRNQRENQSQPLAFALADYQVVTGPQTAFDGDKCAKLQDFERGTSNTYLVTEATAAVPWLAPYDIPFDMLHHGVMSARDHVYGMGSYHIGGTNVVLADGSTEFVTESKTREDIAQMQSKWFLRDLSPVFHDPLSKDESNENTVEEENL